MKKSLGAKSLACPTPTWIIGTFNEDKTPNIMTVSWAGICCSKPAAVTISLRKSTQTFKNLRRHEVFTINIPSKQFVKEVDFLGMASGRVVDQFKETGLTAVSSEIVYAPYVDEFSIILECKVFHSQNIGVHTQFIGEILDVKADDTVFGDNGTIDMSKVDPVLFSPSTQTYFSLGNYLGDAFNIGKKIL